MALGSGVVVLVVVVVDVDGSGVVVLVVLVAKAWGCGYIATMTQRISSQSTSSSSQMIGADEPRGCT